MKVLPAQEGLPEIVLYDSLEELRKALGQPLTHGLYDKEQHRIHATAQSLAHEIAHFKDFKSGRLVSTESINDPAQRRRARIRNEMVAIIFAWIKTREVSVLPEHEKKFLEWLYLMIDSGRLTPEEPLETMSFQSIQNFAERILNEAKDQERVLAQIFKHYLKEPERIEDPLLQQNIRA